MSYEQLKAEIYAGKSSIYRINSAQGYGWINGQERRRLEQVYGKWERSKGR